MKQVLFFDSMLTPKIIIAVYWIGLVGLFIGTIVFMFVGYEGFTFEKFMTGLFVMVGGAVGLRIWCELLIVLFKMNEALQGMRNKE
jgi:hypothetical protein